MPRAPLPRPSPPKKIVIAALLALGTMVALAVSYAETRTRPNSVSAPVRTHSAFESGVRWAAAADVRQLEGCSGPDPEFVQGCLSHRLNGRPIEEHRISAPFG